MSITAIDGGRPNVWRAQGSATFAMLQNRTTGDVMMVLLTSVSKPSRLSGVRDSELAKS
jgi:hypothetical protein